MIILKLKCKLSVDFHREQSENVRSHTLLTEKILQLGRVSSLVYTQPYHLTLKSECYSFARESECGVPEEPQYCKCATNLLSL